MGQAESDAPVAIVTGGAKGIGAAVTRRLSEDGFTVAVFDVDANAGEKLVASLSARDASSHLCDVSSYESVWDRLIGINLRGPIHLCHAVLPHMVCRGRGAVVNVASDAGRVGSSGETVYAACKGGVTAFTKSVAREMARHGIRANCVCPGPTDTPLLEEIRSEETGDRIIDAIVRVTPFRRLATPEDIAGAISFFASADSSFITGQVLSVSGGLTMAG